MSNTTPPPTPEKKPERIRDQKFTAQTAEKHFLSLQSTFQNAIAPQDEFSQKLVVDWLQADQTYRRWRELRNEIISLNKRLKERNSEEVSLFNELYVSLKQFERTKKSTEFALLVRSMTLPKSFELLPLTLGKENSPTPGKIEQYHSQSVSFQLLQSVTMAFWNNMQINVDKIVLFDSKNKQPTIKPLLSNQWIIKVDNLSCINIAHHEGKLAASWDLSLKTLKPEKAIEFNYLLNSVLLIAVKVNDPRRPGQTIDFVHHCQLLKPKNIPENEYGLPEKRSVTKDGCELILTETTPQK